ncbi:hypothetical protein CEUSTIGMA_g10051.t1 [Chlamydomonas eustigma]|uniref:Uncharacterized protein n=1 Tax=Chlamydomonas eustigma TaxID=1157962 RepID=A0A250XHR1_9CHLO|nr:hypothetical protein CEUSTIGMA_g10051.t1 [Chlamydomonas eustigma]|eukprot:GAX82625.1 hypothetical protein CEUSTIGMA_g10051.t1 [Chlamydomonas eustigma]
MQFELRHAPHLAGSKLNTSAQGTVPITASPCRINHKFRLSTNHLVCCTHVQIRHCCQTAPTSSGYSGFSHSRSARYQTRNISICSTPSSDRSYQEKFKNSKAEQDRPTKRRDAATNSRRLKGQMPIETSTDSSKQRGGLKSGHVILQNNVKTEVTLRARDFEDDYIEGEEEMEEEDEGEEELDGEPVSKEEAERLIFGNKDFTQGPVVKEDREAQQLACEKALNELGISPDLTLAILELRKKGCVPTDVDVLTEKVQSAFGAAGGTSESFEKTVALLCSTLSLPSEGWSISQEEVLNAALSAPRVLSMPVAAVQQRVAELTEIMKITPSRACELCCRSPALLLTTRSALETKLRTMYSATGLDMEACAIMITVHMFPGLKFQ